ncbi:MAG: molybdopterin-dependent oxidoreductase, partial [Firmicutes bacterium]|nr:molybdopterin-dependent oxidoreductase [Bacillota bacterium]
ALAPRAKGRGTAAGPSPAGAASTAPATPAAPSSPRAAPSPDPAASTPAPVAAPAAPTAASPRPAPPALRPIDRREFLAWAGGGLLLAAGAAVFGTPLVRLWQSLGRPAPREGAGPAGVEGWPGFQLYTVVPGYPDVPPQSWRLEVNGLVQEPFTLSFAEFLSLPQTAERETFQCVTGWVVPNVKWQGVRLAEVVARARPLPEARFLTFYSADGVYTESLSLEQAQADDVLLAHSLNGSPLPRAQGAPVRLVVPSMYGYKSLKWLTRIEFTAERHLGYWEVRGYEADAYIRDSSSDRK